MFKKMMILSILLAGKSFADLAPVDTRIKQCENATCETSFAAVAPVDAWIKQCRNATGETKKTYDAIRKAKAHFGKASCQNTYIRLLKNKKLEIQDPITDLNPIAGLTNLEYLSIYGQSKESKDSEYLKPLAGLTNLKQLWLGSSGIKSIDSLSNLENLEILRLNGNDIDDISAIMNMKKLRKLHLAFNRIADIRPVTFLGDLEFLDLRGNLIKDLSSLRGSTQLATYVDLGNNFIKDTRPLEGKIDIKFLNLEGNIISDFGPITGVRKVYKGFQYQKKKYPKKPVKPHKVESPQTQVKPKPNFYARLMQKPSNFLEFYKQAHDLAELVEDIHQMKLYYTYVSNAYRTNLITQQERSELIVWGLDTTANYTTCEHSIADYKIILDKAEDDKLINRKTRYILDSKAEDRKTENQPYIRDLQAAVKRNTEHLKIIESNVGAINDSLNQLKEGIRHKMAIETTVGFISAVLNALSFGVAGSAVQGAMEFTLGQIVDFGDFAHIIEVAESINDVAIQDIIEYALEAAEDRADEKLEEACKDSYTLAVLAVAAASIDPQSHKINQMTEKFEQPFLSDLKSGSADSMYDFDLRTFDEEDYPLHAAIKYGDIDLLTALIEAGEYDINMHDQKGRTPADFAAIEGGKNGIKMVWILEKHGGMLTKSIAKTRHLAKQRQKRSHEISNSKHFVSDFTGIKSKTRR